MLEVAYVCTCICLCDYACVCVCVHTRAHMYARRESSGRLDQNITEEAVSVMDGDSVDQEDQAGTYMGLASISRLCLLAKGKSIPQRW